MSNQIKYKVAKPGEASTGADSLFDDLATKSQDIGQDNTRTEWVSTKHVDFAANPSVLFRTSRENTTTEATYTGTAYQTVSHGTSGSTELIFAGVIMNVGDVIRVNWSWRTAQQGGSLDAAGVKGSDFWWIQLQVRINAAWVDIGFPMRNSLSSLRNIGAAHTPVSGLRMYSGTFCDIASTTQTVSGVRAQVKAETANGAIVIGGWNLSFKIIGA
jgi:hypothetical protein